MARSNLRRLRTGLVMAITAAALGLPGPAQATSQANFQTGTITGHLTADGAPVANAAVTATGVTGAIGFGFTDDSGAYAVTDLPPDQYKIFFQKFGEVAQWAHQKLTRSTADLFPLAADAQIVVDEQVIPTGTLQGQLTDSHGAPADADIDVVNNEFGTVAFGRTTAGVFQFAVPPGRYTVRFVADGLSQWVPGSPSLDGAGVIEIRSGEATVVDEALLSTGSIDGRLVDQSGNGVAGVFVQIRPEDNVESASATTDDTGAFRVPRAYPSQYRIGFNLPNGQQQWAHQKRSFQQADLLTVTADQTTTVNETLLPTGAIAGRLVDQAGNGVEEAMVEIQDAPEPAGSVQGTTDATGNYRVEGLLVGTYVVRFTTPDFRRSQYAVGQTSFQTADVFTVTDGGTTVVDDTLLPTGTLRITARDATTGAPIAEFCANAFGPGSGFDCTTTGEVTLTDLMVGEYDVFVFPEGLYLDGRGQATVAAGDNQVTVDVALGGLITTTIRDAVTGQPVAFACVYAMRGLDAIVGERPAFCSDTSGAVSIGPLEAGTYRLLTTPHHELGYGIQWVGPKGGTGNQLAAQTVNVTAGRSVAGPRIKLDKAGSITGVVTDAATGRPLANIDVVPFSYEPGPGPVFSSTTDADGRYTMSVLGPYKWPILFTDLGGRYAWQWTGGTPNRFLAAPVTVRSGGTTTANAKLQNKIKISGTVRDTAGAPIPFGRIIAYNAVTGDVVGVDDFTDGRYALVLLAPQVVKIRHEIVGANGWYDRAADFAHAKAVTVPAAGTKTVNITVDVG